MAPRNEIVPELNQAFEVSGGICNYFRNCDGEEQELWLAASMSKKTLAMISTLAVLLASIQLNGWNQRLKVGI